ncbi:MAG TPA: hypothetical protein VGQ14_06480 [Candidatus Eisenbacteria bacterium]|nr:hypothetical protein [Candidatus Eisenbacteria bacterium]
MTRFSLRLFRDAKGPLFLLVLALLLFSGCLSYEKSQTKVTIDKKTGIAKVQVTYWNLASTETGRGSQREDFEQLDSLRRSDAYFLSSFLRSANAGRASKRKVWIEKGHIHASYTIETRDLNQIAEGWSADTTGYRYVSMLEISRTNGQRTTDEKPTVLWPRKAVELVIGENDPHFSESVPFLPEFRESLDVRLRREAPKKPPKSSKSTAKKKTPKNTSKRSKY